MRQAEFDTSLRDSQGTEVVPVKAEDFDLDAYAEYEESLLEKNKRFAEAEQGLLVYRRVRANGVFFDRCRDYRESLELQLGALKAGMSYRMDIPNFLEPWYGIGYIASCFGSGYQWLPGQAPAVLPRFSSVRELLNSDFIPIARSPEGKRHLEMIEYFMDRTKGKVPVSFSDVQSPLNMLTYLLPVTNLFLEIYDDPAGVKKAAKLCADLLKDFLMEQKKLIGNALAYPGHGFASSRAFSGLGLSNDTSIMLQEEDYTDIFKERDEELGDAFGGIAYHSCGVWEKKIEMVKSYRNIFMADGAFTIETDPAPNRPEIFAGGFQGTGIILNARAVGNAENSFTALKQLWRPKQKLIAVTYCKTPQEQEILYERLHEMEGKTYEL